MREIKFRAWNGTKMFYPEDFRFNQDWSHRTNWSAREDGVVLCSQGDSVLMQFTGLRDNNGKEIYEGDIVKGRSCTGTIFSDEVVYDEAIATFVPLGLHASCGDPEMTGHIIVGNVYENPELKSS